MSVWTLRRGATELALDHTDGYAVKGYDLGFPQIREVTDLIADGDGETDLTAYYGARIVSLDVRIVGSPAERQSLAAALRGYLDPASRVELLWQSEAFGACRMIGRGSQWSGKVGEALSGLGVHAAWSVPSGLIESATEQMVSIFPGSGTTVGRVYDLVYPRVYPAGVSPGAAYATVGGTARVPAIVRIYGPCVDPEVKFLTSGGWWDFSVNGGVTVPAGDHIEIDTAARTARVNGLPGSSVFDRLDFATVNWQGLVPGLNEMRFTVVSGSGATTQADVIWRDSWI